MQEQREQFRPLFFSFVIPAYNEEALIERTLSCLKELSYPPDRYEVIVVENGSTDATYEKARTFQSPNFRIFHTAERGVSRARNFGIAQCSPRMEWCLILDADTFIKKPFLSELNEYLRMHPGVDFGTTTVLLDDETKTGAFWTRYLNWSDRWIRIMHRIHIVRKDLLPKVAYDEELRLGEDLRYSRDLAQFGTYFFMPTGNVIASARRFKKKGYIAMFFINMLPGLPKRFLVKRDWEPIR